MVLAGTLTSHINLFILLAHVTLQHLKTVKYRKNLFLFSWRVKRRREQLVRGTEQSKNILLHFFV